MRFSLYASVAALLLAGCAPGRAYAPIYGGDPPNLVYLCGSNGMTADLATGSCIAPDGGRTSVYDLYPPLMSPYPTPPDPGEAIMACGGRGVDLVTGQCF